MTVAPASSVDERELIARVRAGDGLAERALYDAHVDRVFRLAYRLAGDDDLARDFTQETFIRAFERLDSFRGEAALSTWLYTSATTVPLAGPREERWARTAAERARRAAAPRVLALRPWLRWGLAAAAVLVLGIALGRLTAPAPQLATPADTTGTVAYRIAAAQYLTRTEALLA